MIKSTAGKLAQMITYVGKISVMHGPSYLLGVPSFFPVVVIAVAVTRVRFLGVVRAIIIVVVVAAAHSLHTHTCIIARNHDVGKSQSCMFQNVGCIKQSAPRAVDGPLTTSLRRLSSASRRRQRCHKPHHRPARLIKNHARLRFTYI